jgi:superfamily II DNA or RNA helicase
MDYNKLRKRIDDMMEYESDAYFASIIIDKSVSDKLFDYQIFHVLNIITAIRSNNHVLDGSDTGTGKTFTSIAVCAQTGMKPAIIGPKIGAQNWRLVCKLFNVTPLFIASYESIKNGKCYDQNGETVDCEHITVTKTEAGKKITAEYKWKLPANTVIIFDEVHRCKNQTTKNGKLLLSTKDNFTHINKHHYTERRRNPHHDTPIPKVLMLSATLSDTPDSFHIFGYMLGFYKFVRNGRNWINGMIREDMNNIVSSSQQSSINRTIYPFKGSRMRIQELGDKFPKNQVSANCYSIDKKQQAEVNKAFATIDKWNTKLKQNDTENDKNILTELVRARQALEKMKIPIFIELIDEHIENGYSVVVFVNFNETLDRLADHYDTHCVIYGNVTEPNRQYNITEFQANRQKIIICNIKAASSAISLHDIHGVPRVSLISPPLSATDLKQALGRIHRAGSKSPALQRIIYCANTCEEVICNRIKEKLHFMDKLNDDDLILK